MPPPRDLLRALPVFAADLPHFDAGQTSADPVPLFTTWLLAALDAGVPEPHAMTLATVDGAGRPSTRVLICKDVGAAGHWYFASGAASRKGRELATAPGAALGFHWPQLGRQIRIRGTATSTGAERSAADFLARSPGARAESGRTPVRRPGRPGRRRGCGVPDRCGAWRLFRSRRRRGRPEADVAGRGRPPRRDRCAGAAGQPRRVSSCSKKPPICRSRSTRWTSRIQWHSRPALSARRMTVVLPGAM